MTRQRLSSIFFTLLSISLTLFAVLCAFLAVLTLKLPPVEGLRDTPLQVPMRIYTQDHELIGLFGEKNRKPIAFHTVPSNITHAILATEDQRFYEHFGIDYMGLLRAVKELVTTGKKTQGASTITMQVARNYYLSPEKTYTRKINEMLLALKIESNLTKNEIFELYLNKIYFGHRAYGIQAAAYNYYGTTVDQLDLAQAAMLAGLPKAPSRNNPIDNPKQAIERRDHVLYRMLTLGYIDTESYQQALLQPNTASKHWPDITVDAPHIAEMVRKVMVKQYGSQAYDMGLNVFTTLRAHAQTASQNALIDGLQAYDRRHSYRLPTQNLAKTSDYDEDAWASQLHKLPVIYNSEPAAITDITPDQITVLRANREQVTLAKSSPFWSNIPHTTENASEPNALDVLQIGDVITIHPAPDMTWSLDQIPQVEGALVSVDPKSGRLISLSGGYHFSSSHFNRAIQAERQPGSAIKPFIYSAALAKGYTLASMINDAPIVIEDSGENQLWRPHNDNYVFRGPTRLRNGLVKSRNLVSIRLLHQIGIPYTIDYLKQFGFNSDKLPHSLSLALGSGEVSPMALTQAFTTLASGGYKHPIYFIDHITGQKGENIDTPELHQPDPVDNIYPMAPESEPADPTITPENAYLITNILQDVINTGTGRRAKVLNRADLAGKTGSTNDNMDAWFVGFNPQVLTTAWVGFDQMTSLHEFGSQAALPIWIDYMRQALKGVPNTPVILPENIVHIRIDPITGLTARPNQLTSIFEVFEKSALPATDNTQPSNPQPHTDSVESIYN